MNAAVSAALALLWLCGLAYAGPVVLARDREPDVADRIRASLTLGVAIPFALGLLGILMPATCCVALGVLCIVRCRSARAFQPAPRVASASDCVAFGIVVAGVLCVSWPQLVRPLLDGDSLAYHLPNAAAWLTGHSLWQTTTRYWWYPGGSELFALTLLAAGGPLVVGWAGVPPLLLIAARSVIWCKREGGAPWMVALIVSAVLTTAVFAKQAGTLENDAWVAAFALECAWLLRLRRSAAGALAVLVLLKPTGIVYASIVALVYAAPLQAAAAGLAAYLLWIARDAVLLRGAVIPPSSTAVPNIAGTTILAHGADGLATLATAAFADNVLTAAALVAAVTAWFVRSERRAAVVAAAFVAVALVSPFGFDNGLPQLRTGQSLRFFLPAIVLGTVLALTAGRRALAYLAPVFAIALVFNVRAVLGIFWNDATVHDTVAVALLAGCAAAATAFVFAHRPVVLRAGLLLLAAVLMIRARAAAGSHPADYYADQLGHDDQSASRVYAYVAHTLPARLIVEGLNSGNFVVVSPRTRIADGRSGQLCEEMSALHAPVVIPIAAATRTDVRALEGCAVTAYRDASAAIFSPPAPPAR